MPPFQAQKGKARENRILNNTQTHHASLSGTKGQGKRKPDFKQHANKALPSPGPSFHSSKQKSEHSKTPH